jgi:hypothetical protein
MDRPEWLRLSVGFRSGARSVGNCPSFGDQQHCLSDGKRQDVTDACSTEIDVVDRFGQFLDQAYTHRVRVVLKSVDPMPGCVSCHHPNNIDFSYVVSGFSRTESVEPLAKVG